MNRRQFLATGAALSVATFGGCTGCAQAPAASMEMDPVTDLEIAKKVTHQFEADEDNPRYRLAREAIETGSATVQDTEQPAPAGSPFVYEGTVYELSVEVVASTPARSFSFTLDPAEGTVTDAETVRFEDLPAVDREKFAARGWATDPFLGVGSSFLYLESEIPDSALVPDPRYSVIVWDKDTRGRFTVEGSHETSLKTYRYTATVVHPSAAEFGREIRRNHEFTLAGLSEGERDIVAKAIEQKHGYSVPTGERPPNAVYELAERFRRHDTVEHVWETPDRTESASGQYIVRYEGTVYWTEFLLTATRTATS